MIKLVVGLGNPGVQYEFTRHNIGWLAIDQISFFEQLAWKSKFKGDYSLYNVAGDQRYFLKPQTYMNLSGESVAPLARFYKVKVSEILVIHDELDLPFGRIAFKKGGGLAGHNGLKSMAQHLGSQDFLRLRLGISRPINGRSVSDWVLSGYSKEEEISLERYLKAAAMAIEDSLKLGYEKAAGKYSGKTYL